MPDTSIVDELKAVRAKNGGRVPTTNTGAAPAPDTSAPASKTGGRSMAADFVRGGVKGLGETGFGLGELVHATPVLGSLTDELAKLVGPKGTDPEAAFNGRPDILEPKSGAESAGKTAEQIGEFFMPTGESTAALKGGKFASRALSLPGLASKEATSWLARMIPNAASPETMAKLNRLASVGGKVLGEGGTAGALSTVHGSEDPEAAAGLAAAGPLVGAAGRVAAGTLDSPLGKQLAPYLAALTTMKAIPSVTGLGATMGAFGLTRMGMRRLMSHPDFVPKLQNLIQQGSQVGMRGAAAVADQALPSRRRLP